MKPIQVLRWCRETFHYYVVFTNSIFFILGLVLSYKLVEKTFLNILITRLTEAWGEDEYDLRRGVVVVNFQEGTTAVLVPLFAYAADVYTGRFKMVVFSTTVCIIGLILNYLAIGDNEELDLQLFYPGLGLMALAQAAQTVTLEAFLDDQLRPMDLDEDQRRRRTRFWWTLVSFVAALFALFGPLPKLEFKELAVVLITVMGVCFLVFLLATNHYNSIARIQNPFKDVGIVIIRAIANKNVKCPQTQEPRVPWLRWLDRAVEVGSCSAEQVRGVKLFLKMLPLWFCFLTVSLVSASGSTFFFEEANSLEEASNSLEEASSLSVDDDDLTAILFLSNLLRFTEFAASETSSYALRKLRERKKYSQQKMELVRVGIGMTCCVLCCVVAWETATLRQRGAMSAYWLTPQYLLLGLMGGLTQDGLESFYESQVSESLSRYGQPFGEFVTGVGIFFSILCVLVFGRGPFRWFQSSIEDSRLNKYYIFLAVLSVVNVMIYCSVVRWYGDDVFLVEDEEMDTLAQLADQVVLASSAIEEQYISHPSPSIVGQPADAPTHAVEE